MSLDLSIVCVVTLVVAATWALLAAGFIDSSYLPEVHDQDL